MKPFLLGQVFSYSFKLLGKDFWKMFFAVVLGFLAMAIPLGIFIAFTVIGRESLLHTDQFYSYSIPGYIFLNVLPMILILIIGLFILPFIEGVILNLSASRIKGSPLQFGQALGAAAHKYGKLILTYLSTFILLLPAILILGVIIGGFAGMMTGARMYSYFAMFPLLIILYIIMVIICTLLGIAFKFAICVTINEDLYAFPAVFKGFKLLFKGNFWRNIGHFIVMLLTVMGSSLVFGIIISIFAIPLTFLHAIAFAFVALSVILYIGYYGTVIPFEETFTQLMYYNARLQVDGVMFDTNTPMIENNLNNNNN